MGGREEKERRWSREVGLTRSKVSWSSVVSGPARMDPSLGPARSPGAPEEARACPPASAPAPSPSAP